VLLIYDSNAEYFYLYINELGYDAIHNMDRSLFYGSFFHSKNLYERFELLIIIYLNHIKNSSVGILIY
jgi:hypothetical protein